VFEEQIEFVLMRFENPPVSVQVVLPMVELIGRLNEVVLERVVHGTGEEVQKAVRGRLPRRNQSWKVRGIRKSRSWIQTRASCGFRYGRRGRVGAACVRETRLEAAFEGVLALRPTERIGVVGQRSGVALLSAGRQTEIVIRAH